MSKRLLEAANFAADRVEGSIKEGSLDFVPSTFAEIVIHWSLGISMVDLSEPHWTGGSFYYQFSPKLAFEFVRLSQTEPHFFDLCLQVCSANVLAGKPVPIGFEGFTAHVLSGQSQRPRSNGPPRKRNFLEKLFLYQIILSVSDAFSLSITQADGEGQGKSACDIVAQALTTCGRKTTYTELKSLMTHRNHELTRQEITAVLKMIDRSRSFTGLPTPLGASIFSHPSHIDTREKLDDDEIQIVLAALRSRK